MEGMQGDGELDHVERPSPLTDKEKVMIQDSWAVVFQSCDDAGVAILVRYSSSSHPPLLRLQIQVGLRGKGEQAAALFIKSLCSSFFFKALPVPWVI